MLEAPRLPFRAKSAASAAECIVCGRASPSKPRILWEVGLVPGGGVEPPRPEGRRILSPLRLPVPPSRHFVEVLDSTANFTLYVLFVYDSECETVQVNVKVFMAFHRFLSLAHESALRLSPGDDVPLAKQSRGHPYEILPLNALSFECPQHRGPLLAECARNGAPELLWERENLKWAIRRHDSRIAAAPDDTLSIGVLGPIRRIPSNALRPYRKNRERSRA
jgi:hypothetical protein